MIWDVRYTECNLANITARSGEAAFKDRPPRGAAKPRRGNPVICERQRALTTARAPRALTRERTTHYDQR